jgi:hypothetical protein
MSTFISIRDKSRQRLLLDMSIRLNRIISLTGDYFLPTQSEASWTTPNGRVGQPQAGAEVDPTICETVGRTGVAHATTA